MDKLFERCTIGNLKSYQLRILGVSTGKWNNFKGLIFRGGESLFACSEKWGVGRWIFMRVKND